MAEYFSNFGAMRYSLMDDNSNLQTVKNIFERVTVIQEVLNNSLVFYQYSVKEFDTPEIIAHKYYGDAKKHWLVMFSNQITDPYFDFPLNGRALDTYIENIYGDIPTAMATLDHVEMQSTITNYVNGTYTTRTETEIISEYYQDPSTGMLLPRSLPTIRIPVIYVDTTTTTAADGSTNTIVRNMVAINGYDMQVSINESKRNIQLLDKKYASQIESELKKLLTS